MVKIAAVYYHKGTIFSLVQLHLSHLFMSWMSLGQLKLLKSDKGQVYRWLCSQWSEAVLKNTYVCTHTESCKPFHFWTLQRDYQQSSGMTPFAYLPLNVQAPAGLLVGQALTLAVKLLWLSGRQDLPQCIIWFFHEDWYFSLASTK